jgi:hypothetical protein
MNSVLVNRIRDFFPRLETRLFPKISPNAREIPVVKQIGLFVLMTACFSLVGVFLPVNEYVGFDWRITFSVHKVHPYYPPWTYLITDQLTWPLLTGSTLAAYMLAVIRRSVHPLSAAAAIVTLQLFWATFLGQLEGLVLIGLLGLPWLAPFALVKPQISFFAFLTKKTYLIAGLIVLLISLLIWGMWPLYVIPGLEAKGTLTANRAAQDIGIGLVGIPLTLVMMWFSRGDMDMLMLAGSTCVPYLIPYHLMPVAPAIARLKPWKAVVAGLLSWLPLSANWIGPSGWWLGWLFVAWLWLNLASRRYPASLIGRLLK